MDARTSSDPTLSCALSHPVHSNVVLHGHAHLQPTMNLTTDASTWPLSTSSRKLPNSSAHAPGTEKKVAGLPRPLTSTNVTRALNASKSCLCKVDHHLQVCVSQCFKSAHRFGLLQLCLLLRHGLLRDRLHLRHSIRNLFFHVPRL